jgi:translocation and assembly module TamB
VAGLLTLGFAALLYWLLATIGGRDVLLAQIRQRLPAEAHLSWERAEGPASGPLVLHGVRFTYLMTDRHGQRDPAHPRLLEFSAQRVMLDPALRPLLGRLLRLDALQLEGATLEIPESDEPFELPRWPSRCRRSIRRWRCRPTMCASTAAHHSEPQAGDRHPPPARRPGCASGRTACRERSTRTPTAATSTCTATTRRATTTAWICVATAVLPAATGTTSPRLGLVARGDLRAWTSASPAARRAGARDADRCAAGSSRTGICTRSPSTGSRAADRGQAVRLAARACASMPTASAARCT